MAERAVQGYVALIPLRLQNYTDRPVATLVLATWVICSQNLRVAPVQSLVSPILPSRKVTQIRKLKNRQSYAQWTYIHLTHQPSREVICSPRRWKKMGQETQKAPSHIDITMLFRRLALLAFGKHALRSLCCSLVDIMQSPNTGMDTTGSDLS